MGQREQDGQLEQLLTTIEQLVSTIVEPIQIQTATSSELLKDPNSNNKKMLGELIRITHAPIKDLAQVEPRLAVYVGIGEKKYKMESLLKQAMKRSLVIVEHSQKEEQMPSEKDAWSSLRKEIQDKLISLEKQRLEDGLSDAQLSNLDGQLRYAIHRVLGMKTGDPDRLNFQLKEILSQNEGGIYDSIEKYLKDYQLIEEKALAIAREKLKTEVGKSRSL